MDSISFLVLLDFWTHQNQYTIVSSPLNFHFNYKKLTAVNFPEFPILLSPTVSRTYAEWFRSRKRSSRPWLKFESKMIHIVIISSPEMYLKYAHLRRKSQQHEQQKVIQSGALKINMEGEIVDYSFPGSRGPEYYSVPIVGYEIVEQRQRFTVCSILGSWYSRDSFVLICLVVSRVYLLFR